MTIDTSALSPRRVTLGLVTLFGTAVGAAGLVIGVAAGVGAVWHATNPSPPASVPAAATAGAAPSSGIHLVIKNVSTPEGSEPAYIGPGGVGAKTLFQVHVGVPTQVTIVNDTSVPHTFTSAALGVDVTVQPGPSTTHLTIKAGHAGDATWQCDVPCGAWVMDHDGYMKGEIEVLQ